MLIFVSGIRIEYRDARSNGKKYLNITSKIIDPQIIDPLTIGIYKVIYGENRDEIIQVSDLQLLQNFHLRNAKQQFIPQFKNLPKLNYLSLEHNEIIFVSKDRFSTMPLVYIDLKFNNILRIEDGSFGVNVKHVYLSCNMLNKIEPTWFLNPAKLEVLDLDANNIQYIENDTLKNFVKLDYIYLMHNGLHTIGDGAFAHKNFISEMWLAFNHLTRLPNTVFRPGQITMEILDLSYNKLSYLPFTLMQRLNVSKAPHIDGNPWKCPCYYDYILKWINWDSYGVLTDPDRPNEPRCVVSKGFFKRHCTSAVDHEAITYFLRNSSPPPEDRSKYCRSKKV